MFVQYLNKMTDADSAIPITLTVSGLVDTASILGMTLMWATANRHPVRPRHRQLHDRPALPHAHTPVGSPGLSGARPRTVASPPTVPTSGA
jgi:hypothetical protein